MKGNKPQKGNQLDLHAGPFNRNSSPLGYKVPPKEARMTFFKPKERGTPIESPKFDALKHIEEVSLAAFPGFIK